MTMKLCLTYINAHFNVTIIIEFIYKLGAAAAASLQKKKSWVLLTVEIHKNE